MSNKNKLYFGGLDGIRTVAALSVLFSHIQIEYGNVFNGIKGEWNAASYGVSVFFTLSGFLITYLLLVEKEKGGDIQILKFYMRRVLRIWPLYYLYLFVVGCILYFHGILTPSYSWYILMGANIPYCIGRALPYIAHLWSIGVEEQFYLVWPWIMKKVTSIKPLVCMLLALIAIKFIFRYVLESPLLYTIVGVNRFEQMILGGLFAFLLKENNVKRLDNYVSQMISWAIFIAIMFLGVRTPGPTEHLLLGFATACIIIGQIKTKHAIINLDWRPLRFLGKISYGIYVIHPLVLCLFGLLPMPTNMALRVLFNIAIILVTIFFAYLSYTYYESYFLKKKKYYVAYQ